MGSLFFFSSPDDVIDSHFKIPAEILEIIKLCTELKTSDNGEFVKVFQNYAAQLKKLMDTLSKRSYRIQPSYLKACITEYLSREIGSGDQSNILRLLFFADFSFRLIDTPNTDVTLQQLKDWSQTLFDKLTVINSPYPLNLQDALSLSKDELLVAIEQKKLQPTLGLILYILKFSKAYPERDFNTDFEQHEFESNLNQIEQAKLLGLVLGTSTPYLFALTNWFQSSTFDFYPQEFINWLLKPLDAETLTQENFIKLMYAVNDSPSPQRRGGISPATCLLFALYEVNRDFITNLPLETWLELFKNKPSLLEDFAKQTTAKGETNFTALYHHILRQYNQTQLNQLLPEDSPVQFTTNTEKTITVHTRLKELENFVKENQISSPMPENFGKFSELCKTVVGKFDKTQLKDILKQAITSLPVFQGLLFSESARVKELIEEFTTEDTHELITQFETCFQEDTINFIALNKVKLWFVKRFKTAQLPSALHIKLSEDLSDDAQLQEMLTQSLAKLLEELKTYNFSMQGQNPEAISDSKIAEIKQNLKSFINASHNQTQISEILAEIIPTFSQSEFIDIFRHSRFIILIALFEPKHYAKLAAKVKNFTDEALTTASLQLLKEHPTFCPQWFKLLPAEKFEKILTNILAASGDLPTATRLSLVLLGLKFNQFGYLTVTSQQNIEQLALSHVHPGEVDYNPYFLSRLRKSKKLAVQPVFDRLAALTGQPDYYKLYSGVLNTLHNITLARSERKIVAENLNKLTTEDAENLLLLPLPKAISQNLFNKLAVNDEQSLKDILKRLAENACKIYKDYDTQQQSLRNVQAQLFNKYLAERSVVDKLLFKLYSASITPQFICNSIYNYFIRKNDVTKQLATIKLSYSEFVSAKNYYKGIYYEDTPKQSPTSNETLWQNDRLQVRKTRTMQGRGEQRTIQLIGDIAQIKRVRQKVNFYRLFANCKLSLGEVKKQPHYTDLTTKSDQLSSNKSHSP